jgi:TusA-related sulfurtransferase
MKITGMQKHYLIILFVLFSIPSIGQKTESGTINFDGIYETKCDYEDDDEGEKSFLRFYPNNKVISVGSECDATVSDLKSWFNMKMEYLSVGNYEINGKKIRFSTTSVTGTVNYRGRITKEGILKLKIESLINGFKHQEKYQFVKVVDLE